MNLNHLIRYLTNALGICREAGAIEAYAASWPVGACHGAEIVVGNHGVYIAARKLWSDKRRNYDIVRAAVRFGVPRVGTPTAAIMGDVA